MKRPHVHHANAAGVCRCGAKARRVRRLVRRVVTRRRRRGPSRDITQQVANVLADWLGDPRRKIKTRREATE